MGPSAGILATMISAESPLRRLPEDLNARTALLLGGVRFCAEVVANGMDSLRNALHTITNTEDQGGELYPMAMTLAWSVVDSANRARILLRTLKSEGAIPRTAGFRAVMRSLETALPLRDSAQHIDERIKGARDDGNLPPVWGVLSWFAITEAAGDGTVLAGESCVLIPGSVFTTKEVGVINPLGRSLRYPIDPIELEAFGDRVSLSTLEQTMETAVAALETALMEQFPDAPTRGSDLLLRLEMKGDSNVDGDQAAGTP